MEGNELKLFAYPGPNDCYIPTAVAYTEGKVIIGKAARDEVRNRRGVEYADKFKMLLPVKDMDKWAKYGWNLSRSPDTVTRDFFEQLMSKLEEFLGRKPEHIVVSIPELWQRTANNFGAEALRRILVDELKLPVDHLLSEPVCAAAYFIYEYQRSRNSPGDNFNLLVCDMGGVTFDVSLCRVRGQKVDVLDFDGVGQEGWGEAGAFFDHNAVKTALSQCGEEPSPEEMLDLLHDFEEHKIQRHDWVCDLLGFLLARDNELVQDKVIYQFRGEYKLTFAQLKECFEPIGKAIRGVLRRLLERCQKRQWKIDRVAIVGGFGQFPLVQHTILQTLGIYDQNDPRFDRTLHSQHRQFYAIAYGAALIANGIIEPLEYYPHTIAAKVRFKSDGRLKEGYLTILEAGKVPAGMATTHWAGIGRQRVLVEIPQRVEPLPVFFTRLNGVGDWIGLDIPPEELPEPGNYYIGIRIDQSNMVILVFESEDGKKRKECRLGNINPILIAKEE